MLVRLPFMGNRVSAVAAILLSLGVLCAGASAAQGSEALLRVERALLERDLEAYESIREAELTTSYLAIETAEALDELLLTEGASLDEVEDASRRHEVAQENAYGALRRAVEARSRIVERRRRIAVLREGAAGSDDLILDRKRIGGRWRIEIASGDGGVFTLRLDGTVIGGGYEMDDGRRGSLRGNLVGTRIQLDRLDDERGLDGVFEGVVDPVAGTARGVWTPTILGDGGPGGASWTGERLSDDDELEDEDLPVEPEDDETDEPSDATTSGSP